jgi:lipopolysaccharide transport system permease protein
MTSNTALRLQPPRRGRLAPRRRPARTAPSWQHLVSHRRVLLRVTRSEFAARYAGSLLGLGWVAVAPLLVLGIYVAVYLVIFRAARDVTGLAPGEYTLYILAGLVPFLAASEALATGVSSLVVNRAMLMSVVFPMDLIPVRAVLTAQATMAVGGLGLVIGAAIAGTLSWTALLFPVIWALNVLALFGLVWMISLLNIVIRDLQHFIAVALMMLLIASPIVYTPSMVPDAFEFWLYVNPFAQFVLAYQEIWVLGVWPGVGRMAYLVAVSAALFVLGGWLFSKGKRVLIDYV